jgi:hypothetical protein
MAMAAEAQIAPGAATGSIRFSVSDRDVDDFLASMDADLPVFGPQQGDEPRLVPPELVAKLGMMAVIQDWCLREIGPNIRAKQAFRFLAPVYVGMEVTGDGRLVETYEKRGRRFVTFEAEYRDSDGRLLLVDRRTQLVTGEGFKLQEKK